MTWFEVSDGRPRFRGRITNDPVIEWTNSAEGAAAIREAAREVGFSLFGRTRAARKRVRRELHGALDTAPIRSAVAVEPTRYLEVWSELAYAPSLPRVAVALQRLVVVPRTMVLARALPGLAARLTACAGFTDLPETFRAFFCRRLLRDMDEAIVRAKPSPDRPVLAREGWACVAVERELEWIDPMWSGPDWRGHVLLFEMPRARLQRRERRELEAGIARLTQDLSALSRERRNGTVRVAQAALAG